MNSLKEASQKELAMWLGYAVGMVLLIFGAIYPSDVNQIWVTIIGAMIIIISHISSEAVALEKTILECRKKQGGE